MSKLLRHGEIPLETMMRCRTCNGSTSVHVTCDTCGGSGPTGWDKEYDCLACHDGTRTINCNDCDQGEVTCDRCGGRGYTECNKCDAEGKLVHANFITREFWPSVKVAYQLTGLAENKFKHGLSQKHFKPIRGDLVGQKFLRPQDRNTAMVRMREHSYDVFSQEHKYKGSSFRLNRITTGLGVNYVTSKLPLSKLRVVLVVRNL